MKEYPNHICKKTRNGEIGQFYSYTNKNYTLDQCKDICYLHSFDKNNKCKAIKWSPNRCTLYYDCNLYPTNIRTSDRTSPSRSGSIGFISHTSSPSTPMLGSPTGHPHDP